MECCALSENHALTRDERIEDYDIGAMLFSLFSEVRMRRALLITLGYVVLPVRSADKCIRQLVEQCLARPCRILPE